MLPAFTAAAKALLVHLGEQGLLRGSIECKIQLHHDVEFSGLDNEYETAAGARVMVTRHTVASIESVYNPRVRDQISVKDAQTGVWTNYTLDEALKDNGALRKFVVIKVA